VYRYRQVIGRAEEEHPTINRVAIDCGVFFFFCVAWWVCVNAHFQATQKKKNTNNQYSFHDDSGQQQVTKEQQRLSSK